MTFRIGQAVHVGWTPSDRIRGRDPRLRTAVIVDGPFWNRVCRHNFLIRGRSWRIELDTGGRTVAAEKLLFPIDDVDRAETVTLEKAVTA